jgi:hypothetical protein
MENGARALRCAAIHTTTFNLTMPLISHELMITAVEMVCYFCTAIGIAMTYLFAART